MEFNHCLMSEVMPFHILLFNDFWRIHLLEICPNHPANPKSFDCASCSTILYVWTLESICGLVSFTRVLQFLVLRL